MIQRDDLDKDGYIFLKAEIIDTFFDFNNWKALRKVSDFKGKKYNAEGVAKLWFNHRFAEYTALPETLYNLRGDFYLKMLKYVYYGEHQDDIGINDADLELIRGLSSAMSYLRWVRVNLSEIAPIEPIAAEIEDDEDVQPVRIISREEDNQVQAVEIKVVETALDKQKVISDLVALLATINKRQKKYQFYWYMDTLSRDNVSEYVLFSFYVRLSRQVGELDMTNIKMLPGIGWKTL